MKILVIGGTGLIGKAVVNELSSRHEVKTAGLTKGDFQVDIESTESITQLFQAVGPLDAVVSTLGKVTFKSLDEMTAEDFTLGNQNKLMGQVNLSLLAMKHLNDNGSITLTSGILNIEPIALGTSAALVNGAIDGFVNAASIDMPRGIRINSVSPTVITEAMDKYAPFFRGYKPVPALDAALAYSKSVEGKLTGKVLRVGY